MWKDEKFYATNTQFFSSIQFIVITLIWRNFCEKLGSIFFRQNNLQYTVWKNAKFSLAEIVFREIISLVTSLVKTLLSRNFCQKCVRVNFHHFHSFSKNSVFRKNFVNFISFKFTHRISSFHEKMLSYIGVWHISIRGCVIVWTWILVPMHQKCLLFQTSVKLIYQILLHWNLFLYMKYFHSKFHFKLGRCMCIIEILGFNANC